MNTAAFAAPPVRTTPNFLVTASTNPTQVLPGQTIQLIGTVTPDINDSKDSIIFTVLNNGTSVATQTFSNLNLTANQTISQTFNWLVPTTSAFGTYSLNVSIKKKGNVYGSATADFSVMPSVVIANGLCGSADSTAVSSTPTTNLCSAGTASSVNGTGPWTWSCLGSNGGTTASCSAPLAALPINGTCGLSNGMTLASAPTSNLCSSGTASSVNGTGPWTWSCSGNNGGITAQCSAALQQQTTTAAALPVYPGCDVPPTTAPNHIYYSDPVNGSMSNDGSQAHPWASLSVMTAATHHLPSIVQPGDAIYLMSGNHGKAGLIDTYYTGFVTIQAAPGQTPVLNALGIGGGSHIIFSGMTIQQLATGATSYARAVNIAGDGKGGDVDNIIFQNNTVQSQADVSSWSQADWLASALSWAVLVEAPNCMSISNNHVLNIKVGISVNSGSNVLIQGNTVDNFAGDGIDYGQSAGAGTISNVAVIGNTITNNVDLGTGSHNDGIQGWTLNGTVGENILIANNYVVNATRNLPFVGNLQGITIFDGAWDNVHVYNNVTITNIYHGLSLDSKSGNFQNSSVINNTVLASNFDSSGGGYSTWLMVSQGSGSVIVRNNLANQYILYSPGIQEDHNQVASVDPHNNITYQSLPPGDTNQMIATNPQSLFKAFNPATYQYDLHLVPNTLAVGFGNADMAPATDIVGVPRVAPVDLGAYAYVP